MDNTSQIVANVTNSSTCLAHRMHQAIVEAQIDVHAAVAEQAALYCMPYLVMLMSVLIGCAGHKLLRPSLMFMAFCVGSVAALHVSYTYANGLHNWNCDAVVVASVVIGVLCSIISAALIKAVSFILGTVAGASLVLICFDACESCNREPWPNAAMLLGRYLVPFWATLAVVSLAGGYICRRKQTRILALVTALIGGWGVTTAIRMIVKNQRGHVPSWTYLMIGFGVSSIGYGVQNTIINRDKQKRRGSLEGLKAESGFA